MTARKRLLALLTTATLTGAVLAASPAQASVVFTTPSGNWSVYNNGDDTYTISRWSPNGSTCPETVVVPDAVLDPALYDPDAEAYPTISGMDSSLFADAKCMSSAVTVVGLTGATTAVTLPEVIRDIPASAFQNDNNIRYFDFMGLSSQPSVQPLAFACTVALCGASTLQASAFYEAANASNWGIVSYNGMAVYPLPTFQIFSGPAAALDRKHAKLVTVLTSNSAGSVTIDATAKIKIGRTWRLRTVCTKTVAITADTNLPTICTAGATARASLRLQKIKFRLHYTFTQTSTGRQFVTASSVTVKRAR